MSAERYLTIEEAALELAELSFDETGLLTNMSSLGIAENSFDSMRQRSIEAEQKFFINQIMVAAERGQLVVRSPGNKFPYKPKKRREFFEVIGVADLNTWLENNGVGYRLKENSQSVFKQQKMIARKSRHEDWQSRMEKMAADLISQGKKSQATKSSLAYTIAKEIDENQGTIERNTRKTW